MTKNKRVPTVTIPSDDLLINVNGEEFYPHTGESVTFKRKMTPRDLMVMADVAGIQDKYKDRPLEAAQVLYGTLCPLLSKRIDDWDWTDDDGKPYPKPSEDDFVETLYDLALEEINYLVEKYNSASAPQETEKNSQQPSSEA